MLLLQIYNRKILIQTTQCNLSLVTCNKRSSYNYCISVSSHQPLPITTFLRVQLCSSVSLWTGHLYWHLYDEPPWMCRVEQTQASSTGCGIQIVSSASWPAPRNQTTQCKWNSMHIFNFYSCRTTCSSAKHAISVHALIFVVQVLIHYSLSNQDFFQTRSLD